MVELRSNIRRMLAGNDSFVVVGEASDGEDCLKKAKELSPHIILMDINMPGLDGLKVTEMLAKERPEIQVVIMSIQSEQEYFRRAMKAGAKDFLTKPFSSSDLVETIQNVFARWIKDRLATQAENEPQAQVLTLFSTKGGVGKTTLAVNLAVSLALAGKRTLLMDCSLQFGDVAITMNLNSSKNIYYCVDKAAEEIAPSDVERAVSKHPSGLDLLLAPSEPAFAEAVKAAHVKQILEHLSPLYQYIIIDTAPHIGEVELAILDRTDLVFLVATLEISSLKNTKLCLKTLSDINFFTEKIKLIINKDIPNVGIGSKDIEAGLAIPVFASVPMDAETAQLSLNQGEPFVIKFPQSVLARSLVRIGRKIADPNEPQAEVPVKMGPFSRLKQLLFGS